MVSYALVVAKKEQLVLLNGAAKAAAKLIPDVAGRPIGLGEGIGRIESRGAVIFKNRPVQLIRAGFGCDLYNPAANSSILRVVVAGRELHLLHRVLRRHQQRKILDDL